MTTPAWQAPLNGLPGQLRASLGSGHLNQLLAAHGFNAVFQGAQVVSPASQNNFYWQTLSSATDVAQKVTMSGTTMGRVTVPLLPVGNGCDVHVTLCPDSGGNPNTGAPIVQTRLPAAVINAQAAPAGLTSGPALSTALFNTLQPTQGLGATTWTSPAASVNGTPSYFSVATSGNFTALLGGWDATASVAVNNVSVTQYLGGDTISAPIPQPALPIGTFYASAAIADGTIVVMGGQTANNTPTSKVWSATFNTGTGQISNWSAQPNLPASINQGGGAGWGTYVYSVGGTTTGVSANATNAVYVSQISNGQLSSWTATTPLPQALTYPNVGVVGNWMIVANGLNSSSVIQSATYYAPILADGTLGAWQTGPAVPQPMYGVVPQWACATTDSAFVLWGGATAGPVDIGNIQVLSVGTYGPAPLWSNATSQGGFTFDLPSAAFSNGDGTWTLIGFNTNNLYYIQPLTPVPFLSVPLYATGLTNGGSYWIVVQAVESANAADTMQVGLNSGSYATDTKTSPRHGSTWSTLSSGNSIPLSIFDTSGSGQPLHVVEDITSSGTPFTTPQRWSSLVVTDKKLLAGAIAVTMQPNTTLNSNPTFTSGVSPWTATNGTLTQSSAQTHGGYTFSGLLTPTGGTSQAYALSELIPVTQTPYGAAQWLLATGWFYTPTTWANFDLSVFWFDSSGAFISSSDLNTSLTGATWTQVSSYVKPPATAAQARILPILNGSPTSAQLLYLSAVQLLLAPEAVPAMASIAQVNYGTAPWPPTGVTQLN